MLFLNCMECSPISLFKGVPRSRLYRHRWVVSKKQANFQRRLFLVNFSTGSAAKSDWGCVPDRLPCRKLVPHVHRVGAGGRVVDKVFAAPVGLCTMGAFTRSGTSMNKLLLGLLTTGALCAPVQVLADCRDIVDDTLAELRAGATQWNDDMERLARAAAGSACVKAGGNATGGGAAAQIQDQPVPAGDDAAVAERAAGQGEDSASASGAKAAGASEEESWSPFKDIKFNKVSASPNKKPYERRRDVNDPEE
jgi:hypothetical protein